MTPYDARRSAELDDAEESHELEREATAKVEMLSAFARLPEAIRSEIKLRVAVAGVHPDSTRTFATVFMERCTEVARFFVLDLDP